MALDIIQVEGCYVSSSLPKALYLPAQSHTRRKRENIRNSEALLHFRPKTRSHKERPVRYSSLNEAPVEGRQHLAVQTDLYLEELCDVVEEADAQCETDPSLDRPQSPIFFAVKTGIDAETQIYPGELFDYDEEVVQETLEDLVDQTLEQELIETSAKEELAYLADLKKDYEARINPAAEEVKRLEETEQKQLMEKETQVKEEEAILSEDEVAQKIIACLFSQNYLSELVPEVYKKLEIEGYFDDEDPDIQDMEETFWPWLMDEVDSEIATLEASCQLLDTLIVDAVQDISETSIIHPPSDIKDEEKEESTYNKINLKIAEGDHVSTSE
ncbi:hypothetical protein JTE90_003266 [Oedothorax gibbosus]|uniref:Uncharacterized protein n=1 Tax=Oedothorax gibbosus TaxID=931172 RepID=A0AAV6V435_9ARAC|nr:hypothetical protein JTE90_003266 [Oedothorax gibbosus]